MYIIHACICTYRERDRDRDIDRERERHIRRERYSLYVHSCHHDICWGGVGAACKGTLRRSGVGLPAEKSGRGAASRDSSRTEVDTQTQIFIGSITEIQIKVIHIILE